MILNIFVYKYIIFVYGKKITIAHLIQMLNKTKLEVGYFGKVKIMVDDNYYDITEALITLTNDNEPTLYLGITK